MRTLRFGVFGAGFWTPFQLAGWRELGSATQCVAIYNRTRSRAEAIAGKFGIPKVYDDPEKMLSGEKLDFVDNITEVGGHKPLSLLAARNRVPTICQKPMAARVADAQEMVAAFKSAGVPFFVHENWRWQTPIRAMKGVLSSGVIGTPFRARIDMISGFEGWLNQPALAQLEQFILTDLGTHILDVARFLFGEARNVYCTTKKTLPHVLQGENVATAMMEMGTGPSTPATVACNLAYAQTPLERECFPQTLMFVEADQGSVELTNDYWIRTTTRDGTHARRYPPPRYAWADPAYDIAHASIVEANRDFLKALRGEGQAETTGEDNLRTIELVFAAYKSAETGEVVRCA